MLKMKEFLDSGDLEHVFHPFPIGWKLPRNLATLLSSLSFPIKRLLYPPLFSSVPLWILIRACNTSIISSRILWCHYLLESQFEYLSIERMAAMALAAFWLDGEEQDLQVPVEHSRTAVSNVTLVWWEIEEPGLFATRMERGYKGRSWHCPKGW